VRFNMWKNSFLSAYMYDSWWSNCLASCPLVLATHLPVMMFYFKHSHIHHRNYLLLVVYACLLGCKRSLSFHTIAVISPFVFFWIPCCFTFRILCHRFYDMPFLFSLTAPRLFIFFFVRLWNTSRGRRGNCPCIICGLILPPFWWDLLL